MAYSKSVLPGVQFTPNGPLIPVKLLQAFEEGGVVIFVGAGVSRNCGLPDFKELVEKIYANLDMPFKDDERSLFESFQYDAVLGLLESRLGGNPRFRSELKKILSISETADLDTHKALLQLATSKGKVRLVTTNFDEAFELSKPSLTFDYAPYLPLPSKSWNSVVNLHGGLKSPRDHDGKSLVLTSADFGRAYITEGWARRFLSELFRRSTAILFVGYSVSDPAVRYLVDAFAADRKAEEEDQTRIAKAYILTDRFEQTWRSRGIEPIIYETDNHHLLHETLRNCAKRYTTGSFDRAGIIREYCLFSPIPGINEEAITQMVWAVSDPSGITALRFAQLQPSAHIGWLEVFPKELLLNATGIPSQLTTVSNVTVGLTSWLCNHLGSPELINWIVKNGSHLHPHFRQQVRYQLGKADEPQLPKGAEAFWRFVSDKNAAIHDRNLSYDYCDHESELENRPWDPILRALVISWIAPTIQFSEHSQWRGEEAVDLESLVTFADVELIPAVGDRTRILVQKLLALPEADRIAQDLLEQVTESIHQGLSYLQFLGSKFYSSTSRCCIGNHPNNHDTYDWTWYVVLLRDCWNRVAKLDPKRAHAEVVRWSRFSFPLFCRFVLWSSGKPGGFSSAESVEYLHMQSIEADWHFELGAELNHYLRRIATLLSKHDSEALTNLILNSPSRISSPNVTEVEFLDIQDQSQRSRLVALLDGGLQLPALAQERLNQIFERHPDWVPVATIDGETSDSYIGAMRGNPGERDENDYTYLDWSDERILLCLQEVSNDQESVKRWRGLLSKDPNRAIGLLESLGKFNCFETKIWSVALEELSTEQTSVKCLLLFAAFAPSLGKQFVSDHATKLSRLIFLYCQEKHTSQDVELWSLWDEVYEVALETHFEETEDPVHTARSSPIGNLTSALLYKIGASMPKVWDEIDKGCRGRLEALLTGGSSAHVLARIILASQVAWLHRLNSKFLEEHFLFKFDWDNSEAKNLWQGYLVAPSIHPDLWPSFKQPFIKVFSHAVELGESESRLYYFFSYLLLRPEFEFGPGEAKRLLTNGSQKCRSVVTAHWWQQIRSGTDYGANIFREQLKYLLTDVWPLEVDLRDASSSSNLARITIQCGDEFPNAVNAVSQFLIKLQRPSSIIYDLTKMDHIEKYPKAALQLVDLIIGGSHECWNLREVLDRISKADSNLLTDPHYVRLNDLVL